MLLNHVTPSSLILAFLISLPIRSTEEISQSTQNSHPQNMTEYFEEKRRLLNIISTGERSGGERITLEEIRLASEKLNSLICPSEVHSPTGDVDEMVKQLRERIDNSFKPVKEQANNFLQLTSPWAQTLNHHLENSSLTREILDQIKTDAKEKGYTLNISDFEKIVQNQELERKNLEFAQENFQNTVGARLVDHYKNGTLTQQVLDAIREEGESLGVPIVLQGLPDGLH